MPKELPPLCRAHSQGAWTLLWLCLYLPDGLGRDPCFSLGLGFSVCMWGAGLGLDGVQGPASSNSLSSG